MEVVDVAIVGGGPSGATCAAFCAAAGLRTVVIEREKFPREKVCGDCVNPGCWSVLQRLQVAQDVGALPHGRVDRVEFVTIQGRKIAADLPEETEIVVKRSLLDQLLLNRAKAVGAEIREGTIVTAITQLPARNWKLDIVHDTIIARTLVAADGRNSTVARSCNLLPSPSPERVALQAHIPLPTGFGKRIVLQFLPEGYSGQAPVNDRELNLCLVGKPSSIANLRSWAEEKFALTSNQSWRTITPLTRAPIPAARQNLFFVGDAARVVEPFTGEGIYYALRSGELAARAVAKIARGQETSAARHDFIQAQAAMYRGRLWINQLARLAVLSPRLASRLLDIPAMPQLILRSLTKKLVEND